MNQREDLSSMFDYDHWANLRWREIARQMGEESILLHIVEAQVTWLCRIEGTPTWETTLDDLPIHMDRTMRKWKRLLLGVDLSQAVSYVNSRGERYENTVIEIVRHVINHGTYHRGQLRGMAGERGIAFPETDYIGFAREPDRVAGGSAVGLL